MSIAWIPLLLTLVATATALYLRHTKRAAAWLWASRIAYSTLVLQAPLYFLHRGGYRVSPPACEWTFGLDLAIYSLTNYAHIVLFGVLFLLTFAQLRGVPRQIVCSAAVTLAVGLLVELAQGVSGQHHCRMRDLVPDSVGALWGATVVWAVTAISDFRRRVRP